MQNCQNFRWPVAYVRRELTARPWAKNSAQRASNTSRGGRGAGTAETRWEVGRRMEEAGGTPENEDGIVHQLAVRI